MKKYLKIFFVLIIFLVIFSFGKYYFTAKFQAGTCVKALDGYIWHVNRFSLGKYSLMGWQNPWWGLEIKMEKDVLERTTASGIPVYNVIECPDPRITN